MLPIPLCNSNNFIQAQMISYPK